MVKEWMVTFIGK